MMAWPLYLRIADALAPEFEVAEATDEGVLAVEYDGRQWQIKAEEVPA